MTDLAIVPGYGVTTSSSLSAFSVGTLTAGASATVVREYEVTPGVNSISSNIGLVATAVPEPSSLALCVIAGTLGVIVARCRLNRAWSPREEAGGKSMSIHRPAPTDLSTQVNA